MTATDWLTARPIAHRGLHDIAHGIVENSASAVDAAIAGRYGVEVDLQLSADGEAMVHHDAALGRLTEGEGRLADLTAADLAHSVSRRRPHDDARRATDLVGGRVTLLLELKAGTTATRG
jgi:glycerophosphoryl diester phosphodiesterase